MTDTNAPRRSLFTRLGGALAVGVAGLLPAAARAQTAAPAETGEWPGALTRRHRLLVDAAEINGGFPLAYAVAFLAPNPPGSAQAVIILRHGALPIALNSAMWEKYKIGASLKITDPATQAPAVTNPFLDAKPGVLMSDEMAVDRLLGAGVIFGACDVALHAMSKRLAPNAGIGAEDAAKEWAANVIPGITVIPSGVWGVNRAQEAGCTYCAGG